MASDTNMPETQTGRDPKFQSRGYETFSGVVSERLADSVPAWEPAREPADGSPNVIIVLTDDLGFSDIAPYGSEIDTPNLDSLADDGFTFTNYHTNPVCSPARASLLTGINSHRVGFAEVAHADPGFPNNTLELPADAPTIAESFQAAGYRTFAVGKWHLAKESHMHEGADQHSWPIQRGFDRYFGHLDGFTQLFHPHRLYQDNSYFEPDPRDDSYLTDTLTDRALSYISGVQANEPRRPFFLYFAHTAVHAPLQAKAEDIEKYRDLYRDGWDHFRQQRFEAQRNLGIVPSDTVLPTEDDLGMPVPPWESLTEQQKQLYARYMAVYAAAVDNVDQNLGRLIDHLKRTGEYENTIFLFMSDNGASGEGGEDGTRSYFSSFVHVPELPDDWEKDIARPIEEVGGPRSAIHYPRGWARVSATPFRYFKGHTFGGGIRSPLIISWPAGLPAGAEQKSRRIRTNFAHVTDVGLAALELAGVPHLTQRQGLPALETDGNAERLLAPLRGQDSDRSAPQYWEFAGHRALVRGSYKIVANHMMDGPFSADTWELYDIEKDPTETRNLAETMPTLVKELERQWYAEAWANTVFPINDDSTLPVRRPSSEAPMSEPITFTATTPPLERYRSSRLIMLRSFSIRAEYGPRDNGEEAQGVLVAHGDQGGGYLLYVEDGRVHFVYNEYGRVHRISAPAAAGPSGKSWAMVRATAMPNMRWEIVLETAAGSAWIPSVMQFIGLAPFSGISIGRDSGSPIDWELYERHADFPFSGVLDGVRYEPGPHADYNHEHLVDVLETQSRIYD